MKINKDLVDATLMLSFISLVLVGTSDLHDVVIKNCTMGALGIICVLMVVFRAIAMRQDAKNPPEEFDY